jgi:hypothetical protein
MLCHVEVILVRAAHILSSIKPESNCRYARGEYEHDDSAADSSDPTCPDSADGECIRAPLDMPLSRKSWIDAEYTNETINPKVCP